jgi:hypothetical protein
MLRPNAGSHQSYVITPEKQTGDKLDPIRVMTWAGEAPGSVVEKVLTQKQTAVHKALPAVVMDDMGIRTEAGGGSEDTHAGLSLWQRAGVWISDTLKGWSMWLLVIGVGIAAFIILPILMPGLAPVFASITGALHGAWDYTTGEVSKLFQWVKTWHNATPSATTTTTAAVTTTTAPACTAPTVVTAPPAPVIAAPVTPVMLPPVPSAPSLAPSGITADAQAVAAQAAALSASIIAAQAANG